MRKKYCIVCGAENFSRSKLYCCLKCKNQDYYNQNRDRLLPNHKEWSKNNPEKHNIHTKKWRENNPDYAAEYYKKWREKKNEKFNESGTN